MVKWIEPTNIIPSDELIATVGGTPLAAQVLARRGITDALSARAFLDPDHYHPCPPYELVGIEAAIVRIRQAIHRQELICVWGDFDVDGQMATTILVSTLQNLGARVTYYIPLAIRESHGIHITKLRKLIAQGVRLLLTCDTGISAHKAIHYAKENGVDTIISDHHALPDTPPAAYSIVSPLMLAEYHPMRTLSGAGMAYKLAEALLQDSGVSTIASYSDYYDLAALGIIADLMPLTGEARYLVQRGLQSLRSTNRLGLKILYELNDLKADSLTEEHISFILAPRLNAFGQMGDASLMVEFLTTQEESRARILAYQIEGLNARRRFLARQVFQAAQAQIENDPSLLRDYPVLILAHPSWPANVIGLVASRLMEYYHKPVVLLATRPGETGRGSARSPAGIDILAALRQHQHLLQGLGGHALAAGFGIQSENIAELRRLLSQTLEKTLNQAVLKREIALDGYLPLSELSMEMVESLERLAPFGPGNPPPALAAPNLLIKKHSVVGRGSEHLQLTVEDETSRAYSVLWWQGAGKTLPEGRFDLAYTVRLSNYRAERSIQISWLDARLLEAQPIDLDRQKTTFTIVDHRQEANPLQILENLRQTAGIQVWREADAINQIPGQDRYTLEACQILIIWTTPPGRQELLAALAKTKPAIVHLFGVDPENTQLETFLRRLAGLVKYALKAKDGVTSLSALAVATAQREEVIRHGLAWLEARGDVIVTYTKGRKAAQDQIFLQLTHQGNQSIGDVAKCLARLKVLFEETSAYRLYFHRAPAEALVT